MEGHRRQMVVGGGGLVIGQRRFRSLAAANYCSRPPIGSLKTATLAGSVRFVSSSAESFSDTLILPKMCLCCLISSLTAGQALKRPQAVSMGPNWPPPPKKVPEWSLVPQVGGKALFFPPSDKSHCFTKWSCLTHFIIIPWPHDDPKAIFLSPEGQIHSVSRTCATFLLATTLHSSSYPFCISVRRMSSCSQWI